jgi:glycerol-3-phosphate O-acyltransferase
MPTEPKIFRFMQERDAIIAEVAERVVREKVQSAERSKANGLEYLLNEVAYLEMQRLERGSSKLDLRPYGYFQTLARTVGRASDDERKKTLRELAAMYAEDVAGRFTPGVYRFASQILPVGLGLLFNAQRPSTLFRDLGKLSGRIVVEGEVDTLKRLVDLGTLIVVPTHSSNLDSIVVGYGLEASGLPPMTYGAGKNLFANPLLSYFMHNLGAYKVDRRIKHNLYKDVLKTYSEVLLERGYHQLFFPGGTRSRSNHLERKLKLGLLGSAITAYTNNLLASRVRPKVFVCPLTINFHLTLEAETLIQEALRQDGGARYIIEDDESADIPRILDFVMKTMRMDHTLYLRFGQPLDPFGNRVDALGDSVDARGRTVDIERYLWADGRVHADRERDAEYTRQCGAAVSDAFARNTVALSTTTLAFTMFRMVEAMYPGIDLYRLLRVSKGEVLPIASVCEQLDRVREGMRDLARDGRIQLSKDVAQLETRELVEKGARVLGMFHRTPVVAQRDLGLEVGAPPLLYYYSNRLVGYGLAEAARAGVAPVVPATMKGEARV